MITIPVACRPSDAAELVRNFNLAKSRGIEVPVVVGGSEGVKDARNCVGKVRGLSATPTGLVAVIDPVSGDRGPFPRFPNGVREAVAYIANNLMDGLGNMYAKFLFSLIVPGAAYGEGIRGRDLVMFSLDSSPGESPSARATELLIARGYNPAKVKGY